MNHIINYFETAPDFHKLILITGTMVVLYLIEYLKPRQIGYSYWKHAKTNALFVLLGLPVNAFFGYAIIKLINWETINNWGLFMYFKDSLSPLVVFILSFLLLDLGEYVYHRLMHVVKPFWMFHAVHHCDPHVDVTTVLREHPGETIIRLSYLLLMLAVLGVPFWALLFRQYIQIASNAWAHANFKMGSALHSVIGTVFVTPDLHHVHHHYKLPLTDTNYGDVLIIWDRIFGTYAPPMDKLKFGLDTYLHELDNSHFMALLSNPFGKYRSPGSDSETNFRNKLTIIKSINSKDI